MTKLWYTEIDDCIMAAYDHVKNTGSKMSEYNDGKNKEDPAYNLDFNLGLKSEGEKYFLMHYSNHLCSQKRHLAKKINKLGLKVIDVINKQLLLFL